MGWEYIKGREYRSMFFNHWITSYIKMRCTDINTYTMSLQTMSRQKSNSYEWLLNIFEKWQGYDNTMNGGFFGGFFWVFLGVPSLWYAERHQTIVHTQGWLRHISRVNSQTTITNHSHTTCRHTRSHVPKSHYWRNFMNVSNACSGSTLKNCTEVFHPLAAVNQHWNPSPTMHKL